MDKGLEVITDEQFEELVYEDELTCVVMFGAERCHVCEELKPTIVELSEDYLGQIPFYFIDVDEYKGLLKRFKLRGIPQVLLFKEAELQDKMAGLKEKEEIKERIEKILCR